MAQNLATRYSELIDERFSAGSVTDAAVNHDYDFMGAQTVKVYSVDTVPMQDYQRSGDRRYGTPAELDNTAQELTMSRDRSFTFTVDRGNESDSMGALNAGRALRRQQDERIIPEIDKYRLERMTRFAGHVELGGYTGEGDKLPYQRLLEANQYLDDRAVPREGRVCFVTGDFRTRMQLDDNYIKAADIDPETRIRGQVGEADLTPVVSVPLGYLPDGVCMLLAHPTATVAPHKLAEYKMHDNPPGINGTLCEGRVYYDAFVLDNKRDGLYALRSAAAQISVTSAAGTASGTTELTLTGHEFSDGAAVGKLKYKTASSVTAPALGDDLSAWTDLSVEDGAAVVSATTGHKLAVAAADADGRCVAVSGVVTVTAAA